MGSVSLINGHIDDDVMTDEQIIKVLEYCSNAEPCENCPYLKQCYETDLADIALDLINRQNSKIERLKVVIDRQKDDIELFDIEHKAIKAKAIKEFLKRLEDRIYDGGVHPTAYDEFMFEAYNLVKEMVGDSK